MRRLRRVAPILILAAIGASLRLIHLGNTFQSSDNSQLAVLILHCDSGRGHGWAWMLDHRYGVLLPAVVKAFTGIASAFGVGITEFWWKLPVALVGTLQIVVYFLMLRDLEARRATCLGGAAMMAVLPIHVFQSRYLYGYEVLAVTGGALALWSLIRFFERPTRKSALLASIAISLYLLSHAYIVPFAACLMASWYLLSPEPGANPTRRLRAGARLFAVRGVWVLPVLVSWMCRAPLAHASTKQTALGFYLADHLPGMLANTGWLLAALVAAGAFAFFAHPRSRSPQVQLFAVCGAAYVAPLVLSVPPGITVIRGYFLMGTFLWMTAALLSLDRAPWAERRPAALAIVYAVCFAVTLTGSVRAVFGDGGAGSLTGVRVERGRYRPDPGTRAAGYLLREHLPGGAKLLVLHRSVEVQNAIYYFGLSPKSAWVENDLTKQETLRFYREHMASADLVVAGASEVPALEEDGVFEQRVVIREGGEPRMWIFARPDVGFPVLDVAVEEINPLYDAKYAARVSLW
jgi:hypothetical protein